MAADVIVKFLADTTQLQAGLKQVEGTGAKVGRFAKGIAASIGGVALAAGISKSVKAASDLNETMSASTAIFGKSAKSIQAWAATASSDFGQSTQQALASATAFGNMFSQMGLGVPQTKKMSKAMVELAGDFSSFLNVPVEDVLTAQQAAFRGEYDALQRFVPTINAAAVETKALTMTGKENAKQLTAQEKATATYAYMVENAGKALGDFDRTSDGAANKQRELAAQMKNLQATVGQALLPAFTKLLQVVSAVAKVFSALPGPVQTVVAVLAVAAAAMGLLWSSGIHVVEAAKGIAKGFVAVGKAIPGLIAKLGALTLAQAAATAGITLAVAAVVALAYWMSRGQSATEKATEAGKKWGKTQIENAEAGTTTAQALSKLEAKQAILTAKLKELREAQAGYLDATNSSIVAQKEYGITQTVAGQKAAELGVQIAELEARHGTLTPKIKELKREQDLAAKAEERRLTSLAAVAAGTETFAAAQAEAREELQKLASTMLAVQGGELAVAAATLTATDAQAKLTELQASGTATAAELHAAQLDVQRANLDVATATLASRDATAAWNALTKNEQLATLRDQRQAYVDQAAATGDASGALAIQIAKIDELIAKTQAIPDPPPIPITVDTAEAERKLKAFRDTIENYEYLHQGGFGRGGKSTAAVQGFASGGTVGGPRGAPQLAVVHGGERILPASRASVTAGGATYNIVVNAPVGTSPAEVGATVIDAIRQYERVAGRAWRTA